MLLKPVVNVIFNLNRLFITLIFILFNFIAPRTAPAREPLEIVATIGQITDVVKTVGGDRARVHGLMGPGVDPHLYKAGESDVTRIGGADIIFYNGLHLEARMAELFEKMRHAGRKTVAVGEAVDKNFLLKNEAYPGQPDPHIWFDVTLWIKVAEHVAAVLSEHDPEHADYYLENKNRYVAELEALHHYVGRRANELPPKRRVLVSAHDAFRYFGRRYGFTVVGLQGVNTESEAGAKDVRDLADFIAANKIRAVFIESSVPERNIRAVQEAVSARGWEVKIGGELFSDAMGDQNSPEGTYTGMIKHNIDTIVDALKE
jgi:manganese/zinc/iron transport system substrate-binding protein